MGLDSLRGTPIYSYIETCVPLQDEITTHVLMDTYTLNINPRYMKVLGTMCDYGVRARMDYRCFGYIQLGKYNPRFANLITRDYLSVEQSYELVTGKKPSVLSDSYYMDYAVIQERAIALYKVLHMDKSMFGGFYRVKKPVNWIEVDCISDSALVDMKVSRTCRYNKDYWCQILLYSLLSKKSDGLSRRHMYLMYPAQGTIKEFNMSSERYIALYKSFIRRWE